MKYPLAFIAWLGSVLLLTAKQPNATGKERPMAAFLRSGEVKAFRGLAYVPDGGQRRTLDLYVPASAKGPWPVIVWVHGGGWQNGSKEQCLALRMGYVGKGYAVASLNYRLSQDGVFPAQIEDCKAALRWLRAHAAEYHLDAKHFGAWGSSAGGHLVAMLGTAGDIQEFDRGENLDQSSRVQAVCDFFGPSDLEAIVTASGYERHRLADSPVSKLIGGSPVQNPQKARAASPITYVSADDPPFLIVHGTKDPVVPSDQSVRLQEALSKAGVRAQLLLLPEAKHGGPQFTSLEVELAVERFFDEHLKSTPAALR